MEKNPPSGVVARVLRRAGLTSAARVGELSEKLARAQQRITELSRELDEVRTQARVAKEKARERAERNQQERVELQKHHDERLAKAQEKITHEIRRVQKHDAGRGAKLDDVRERLSGAEQSVRLGREHLMAIEVKLDIVEGAITVLDRRTRAALASQKQP